AHGPTTDDSIGQTAEKSSDLSLPITITTASTTSLHHHRRASTGSVNQEYTLCRNPKEPITSNASLTGSTSLFGRHYRRNMVVVERVKDAWDDAMTAGSQKVSDLITKTQNLRTSSTSIFKDSNLTLGVASQLYSVITGSKSIISASDSEGSQLSQLATTTVVERKYENAIPNLPLDPDGLILKQIVQYLDPKDLLRFSLLNMAWLKECGTNAEIWADICLRPDAIPEVHMALEMDTNSSASFRSTAYASKRNWIQGKCAVGHLKVADIRDSVTCFLFDSDKILIGTRRHKLTLLPSLKSLSFLPEHETSICCVHFNSDKSSISHIAASGDSSGTIHLWNLFTGRKVFHLEKSVLVAERSKLFGATLAFANTKPHEEENGVVVISAGFDSTIKAHWVRLDGVLDAEIRKQAIGTNISDIFRGARGRRRNSLNFSKVTSSSPIPSEFTPPPFSTKTIGQQFTELFKSGAKNGGVVSKQSKPRLPASLASMNGKKKSISLGFSRGNNSSPGSNNQQSNPRLVVLAPWRGHTGHIYCVKFMDCQTRIVSGSLDYSVRVWDIKSRECLHILLGHSDTVTCVHTCGELVFSGSLDKTIRKWNTTTGLCERVFDISSGWIKCIDSIGNSLISGGWDECIRADGKKIVVASRGDGYQHEISILDFSIRETKMKLLDKRPKQSTVTIPRVGSSPSSARSRSHCSNSEETSDAVDGTEYLNCAEGFCSYSDDVDC
ncbi:WD40-repeat-containing domain protein, partial [Obelidium mucronatum]